MKIGKKDKKVSRLGCVDVGEWEKSNLAAKRHKTLRLTKKQKRQEEDFLTENTEITEDLLVAEVGLASTARNDD